MTMMMSQHENNFCITGPLCRESTGHDEPVMQSFDVFFVII